MAGLLVFYGSYRADRMGIRLADYLVRKLGERGHDASLVDAQAVGLPMLARRYKEFAEGEAPPAMAELADRIRAADGFVLVAGEYNWGMQPGLKNLTDHFLEEWFWRPCAVTSYSITRIGGARAAQDWFSTVAEMGMAPVPATLTCSEIGKALDEQGRPQGAGGAGLDKAFARFADTLDWWVDAAKAQRAKGPVPY